VAFTPVSLVELDVEALVDCPTAAPASRNEAVATPRDKFLKDAANRITDSSAQKIARFGRVAEISSIPHHWAASRAGTLPAPGTIALIDHQKDYFVITLTQ
jgi:hypothetical protein